MVAASCIGCGGRAVGATVDRDAQDVGATVDRAAQVVGATVGDAQAFAADATVADAETDATVSPDAQPAEADIVDHAAPGAADAVSDDDGSGNDGPIACITGASDYDGGCAVGMTTFELRVPAGQDWWYGSSADDPGPSSNWLTLFCPGGGQLYTETNGRWGGADCRDCANGYYAFPIGFWSGGFGDAGSITQTWDGLLYPVSMGCPGVLVASPPAIPGACVTQECAPPGRYVAKMCACPGLTSTVSDVPCDSPTCVDVPFDLPSTGTVIGTL